MRWLLAVAQRYVARLHGLGQRTAGWLDRETWRLLDRFEPLGRAIRNVTTLEAFDLGLVLAAQAFLTLVPLVIVLAAFTPRLLGVQLSAQLQGALGLANSSLAFQDVLAGPGRAARVGGVVGLVLLVAAGGSFASALQRVYERIWQLHRLGVVRSSWRAVAWLIACTLGFVLSGLADAALRGVPGSKPVLVLTGLTGAILFWWWTAHLLLGARVGWRALLPGAALTGGELAALVWLSPLIMPTLVRTTEGQFGAFGTVFVMMVWLTIVCSMVVFGAIIGEVIARERRVARWTRPPAPQLPHPPRRRLPPRAPQDVSPAGEPPGSLSPPGQSAGGSQSPEPAGVPPGTPPPGASDDGGGRDGGARDGDGRDGDGRDGDAAPGPGDETSADPARTPGGQ